MTKKVIIELDRQNKNISVKIEIPQELEDFFKACSENEKIESNKWFKNAELTEHAEFYKTNDKYTEIETKLRDLGLHSYNDYGDNLIKQKAINLAPLRSVGVSEGVELFSENFDNGGIDFEFYVRELALAIKTIWREYISKKSLKAVITYDI